MAPKRKPGRMKRVAEGIYERDGRLVVKWWQPNGDGKGKRLQKTMPAGTTVAQAKAFKGKMEDEKLRRKVRREESCDSFALRWVEDYPRVETTTNMYNRERVSKFAEDFKGRKLSAVTREEARRWARDNPKRVKAVAAMFADATRDGFLDANPFSALGMKQPQGRRGDNITLLTEAELEVMLRIAREGFEDYGPVIAGAIALAAWTGLRPGELYALEWDDIDFKKKTIRVWRQYKSKTGAVGDLKNHSSPRTVALLPPAEAALRAIPRHPVEPWILYAPRGSRFNARVQNYYWAPIRLAFWNELPAERKSRIKPDFDFYELRHFFGSYLANKLRATPYVIAKQMGHKDGGQLAMRIYIHTEAEDAVADVLAAASVLEKAREAEITELRRTG